MEYVKIIKIIIAEQKNVKIITKHNVLIIDQIVILINIIIVKKNKNVYAVRMFLRKLNVKIH